MKAILFKLFLLGFTLIGWSQNSQMPWLYGKSLSWDNFRGPLNTSSKMAAETHSGISYEASIRRNSERIEIEFRVQAYFVPEKSWKTPNKQTAALLRHEQIHFDITELYARMLKKAFAEYDYPKEFDQSLLDELFSKNQHQLDSVQNQYDEDTDHSLFEEGQKLWEQFVDDSISRFRNYAGPTVTVVIPLKD